MAPREEVRSTIPADFYVDLLIYTFILPVIKVRVARPTRQTCQLLPKQYTAITKCHHMLSKYVLKEALVSRIQSLVKQDLGDNFFKHLGFNRYLDASDLPNHIVLEGFNLSITKLNLNDREATIGSKRFLLNPFQNRQSALIFTNGTVTGIIELS